MKQSFPWFLCLLCLLVGQTVLAQKSYLIKAEISGLDNSHTYAYLTPPENEQSHRIDSVKIASGKFSFSGKVAEPNIYTISIKELPGSLQLVLENATILIKGTAKEFWKSQVQGSALTDEMTAYQNKYVNPAREELIANSKLFTELKQKGDSLKAMEYLKLNTAIMDKQTAIAEQYIKEHPTSFYSLNLLAWGWQKFDAENTKKYLQALPTHLQTHSLSKSISKPVESKVKVNNVTQIGMSALAFSQKDTADKMVSLDMFRGKYLLIDFWASWCGPCRAENPNLVKTYEKYKDKGFEILGVSLDDEKGKWLKAIEKDKLTWTQVSDLKGWNNQAALLYAITFVPSSLLLDPQGKILAKDLRGDALEEKLQEILAKP